MDPIARTAARYLMGAEDFAATYGYGLTDADLVAEFNHRPGQGKIGRCSALIRCSALAALRQQKIV